MIRLPTTQQLFLSMYIYVFLTNKLSKNLYEINGKNPVDKENKLNV